MVSRSSSANRRLEAAKEMEDKEEAEMERADIVNHMARQTKAVETLQGLLNDAPRPGRTKGTVSLGMTLCPHPSVSIMATKSLLMVRPSLGLSL